PTEGCRERYPRRGAGPRGRGAPGRRGPPGGRRTGPGRRPRPGGPRRCPRWRWAGQGHGPCRASSESEAEVGGGRRGGAGLFQGAGDGGDGVEPEEVDEPDRAGVAGVEAFVEPRQGQGGAADREEGVLPPDLGVGQQLPPDRGDLLLQRPARGRGRCSAVAPALGDPREGLAVELAVAGEGERV